MDSDTIVVRNVDELFKCGVFCAAYQNSDLFNAGVLVLKPSTEQHKNIKTYQCPNENKCVDQLLNIHFSFLKYSLLFNKSTLTYHEDWSHQTCLSLVTLVNVISFINTSSIIDISFICTISSFIQSVELLIIVHASLFKQLVSSSFF